VDVDAIADELYGLPLDDFTAARNAHVKQARQNGEREAAASIQAMGKPSAAARLANQLVRQHRDELTPLLELGESLRAAMASLSGAELRSLGQQQYRLISALVTQARSLASAQGRTVSTDQARALEETLHAALADPDAAAQLLTGRLTETLRRSGLGSGAEPGPTLTSVPNTGTSESRSRTAGSNTAASKTAGGKSTGDKTRGGKASRASTAAQDRERDRRERAERAAQAERATAEARLEQARAALDQAEAKADQGEAQLDQAKATVVRLREELERATAEQSKADRARHRLRATAEQARRAERAAQHRLDAVTQ
jgi:hypothetical protein